VPALGKPGGRRPAVVSLRALVASLVLVCALAGCGAVGSGEVDVGELLGDPEGYAGETVTVESAVSNPIDHRLWEMADGRLFVVYDRGLDRGLAEGEQLRVTGAVYDFDRQTIEGELDVNIEDHFFTDDFLQDDVAFVAESVERLDSP